MGNNLKSKPENSVKRYFVRYGPLMDRTLTSRFICDTYFNNKISDWDNYIKLKI